MRIGELINKFDNLPKEDQTVSTFNRMFPNSKIEESGELSVKIGKLVHGFSREIFVNKKRLIIELAPVFDPKVFKRKKKIEPEKKEKKLNNKPILVLFANKKAIFNSISEACRSTKIPRTVIKSFLKSGIKPKSKYANKILGAMYITKNKA